MTPYIKVCIYTRQKAYSHTYSSSYCQLRIQNLPTNNLLPNQILETETSCVTKEVDIIKLLSVDNVSTN